MISEYKNTSHEKKELEQQKLVLEIRELKYRNSLFNRFIAPFLSLSFFTICLGAFSLAIQTRNQENQRFLNLIEQATTAEYHEGRIAGIWMLNSYWDNENNSNSNKLGKKLSKLFTNEVILYKPIANTLSAIVASDDDNDVRLAAAEVIGNAYQGDWQVKEELGVKENLEPRQKVESLRFLLYGNGTTGFKGTLTWANQRLRTRCDDEKKTYNKEKCNHELNSKLKATREAISKNWENLENANLSDTDLSDATFHEANLKRANLARSILRDIDLVDANLFRANLINADLTGADLRGANLENAIYNKQTKFTNVKWSKDFQAIEEKMYRIEPGSILINADLSELPLQGANLEKANLSKANLYKSNLSRANLKGAILDEAILDEAILKEATYDTNTTFPEGFDPKEAEMVEVHININS